MSNSHSGKLVILLGIAATSFTLILMAILGFFSVSSCRQFNIDSYEWISRIDIPEIDSIECYENQELRLSVFLLKASSSQNINHFREKYEFQKRQGNFISQLKTRMLLPNQGISTQKKQIFYHKRAKTGNKYWQFIYIPNSNLLIAEREN